MGFLPTYISLLFWFGRVRTWERAFVALRKCHLLYTLMPSAANIFMERAWTNSDIFLEREREGEREKGNVRSQWAEWCPWPSWWAGPKRA